MPPPPETPAVVLRTWDAKRPVRRILAPLTLGLCVVSAVLGVVSYKNSEYEAPGPFDRETKLVSTSGMTTSASSSPHILFFLVDDMGYNDIGFEFVFYRHFVQYIYIYIFFARKL